MAKSGDALQGSVSAAFGAPRQKPNEGIVGKAYFSCFYVCFEVKKVSIMREVFIIFIDLFEGFNSNGTITAVYSIVKPHNSASPQLGSTHWQGSQLPSKAFKRFHVFQTISI